MYFYACIYNYMYLLLRSIPIPPAHYPMIRCRPRVTGRMGLSIPKCRPLAASALCASGID